MQKTNNQNRRTNFSRESIIKILRGEVGLLLILIIISVVLAITSDAFLTSRNLLNVTRQASVVLIIAVGMLCVLLSGEIDLSVGAVAALAGVTCAMTIRDTNSVWLGILVALITGIISGVINGSLTVLGRIPSFIVTLSTMGIYRGLALVLTDGRAVSGLPNSFSVLGAGYIGVVPVSTVISIIFLVFAFVLVHKTSHGSYLKATGANKEAAILSGVPVNKYKFLSFAFTGFMSAIGGIIITSKLLSAQAIAAEGMEMDVLSAVILGGASLSGGVGSVTGMVLGALVLGVINNGMNLIGISAFYQGIVKGVIILIAVLIRRKPKE